MQQASSKAVRPLSRAYQALDLAANNTTVEAEEKLSLQSFQKEAAEKALTPSDFFKSKMRLSLLDTGRFQSAIVDQEMKKIEAERDIPETLRQAYFNMIKAGMKSRLVNDNDYKQLKDTSGSRYEFLNLLWPDPTNRSTLSIFVDQILL